jgi:hypothetical protein
LRSAGYFLAKLKNNPRSATKKKKTRKNIE